MNTQITAPVSGYPLITRERTQKLELLNHLIANLAHAIVVCGPEGVGKTRLLKNLQGTAAAGSWLFCWVKGDSQSSLEKIQESLSETIVQDMPDLKSQSLANAFDKLAARDKKIVLVIDDAGKLVPGLIEKIISYADRKAVLRVILALTHSEIYLKGSTDPAIDDCYQIEIPALSEKQCGEFLEYLSTLPNPRIQFSAINETMVADLYRETHGIPGNLLARLPAADNLKKTDRSRDILTVAVTGLIFVALGVQWWSSRQTIESGKQTTAANMQQGDKQIKQSSAESQTVSAQDKQPEPVSRPPESPLPQETQKPVETLDMNKPTGVRDDVINNSFSAMGSDRGFKHGEDGQQMANPTLAGEIPAQPQTGGGSQAIEEAKVSGQAKADMPIPTAEGGHWLMEQPVEHYTLQLMALSAEQPILEVMQRHQALGQNLRYLKTRTRSGKDRFVLFYGSFSSIEQAGLERQKLPKELQKAWMRKIGAVQKEMGITSQTHAPG